jgi:NAD(P)-dependent dehydrogenase (short-subunit alcohol dehydrogenase family)
MSRLLLTGRSDSIGAAIAAQLTTRFDVIVSLTSQRSAPDDILVDFADFSAVGRAVDSLEGEIDGVVLAHRVGDPGMIGKITSERWRHTIDFNLSSLFVIIRHVLPKLSRSASIVVVGSTAGFDHSSYAGVDYTVSRWGTNGLVRHFADEFGSRGIRINAVCPGHVDLPIGGEEPPDFDFSDVPLGRAAQPKEIAAMVKFLLSDGGSYMTGAMIPVSGGWK